MEIVADTFADVYNQLRPLLLEAKEVSPKGSMTKELLGVSLLVKNPRSRLGYHPRRHLSLPFIIAESILLFNKNDSVYPLVHYNRRILRWSDDGKKMYGSYGHRIAEYIDDIVKKLKNDVDTRQAVLNIYKLDDLRVETVDVPCTLTLQFMIRDYKLHMFTTMRSQDVIWGLFNDFPVFTILQEVIANELGIDVGEYRHTANSLHVYKDFYKMLQIVDSMKPIEFAVPYVIDDMRDLYHYIANPHNVSIEDLEKEDSPFHHILSYFIRERSNWKKGDAYIDSSIEWARELLEDRKDGNS